MPYLDHVLQPPSYGWADANGKLIKPSVIQSLKEFFQDLMLSLIEKIGCHFLVG